MTAGYSGKPLAAKLGVKPGMTALLIAPPDDFPFLLGDPYQTLVFDADSQAYDYIHWFVRQREELEASFAAIKGRLARDGMLWVSWPKKAAKVATDITEEVIRATALAQGLVDVKVCAIDATWSGLKLVYRLKDR